jgi:dipeptidyl aminopeptidase/acylaminoacyl peptidase
MTDGHGKVRIMGTEGGLGEQSSQVVHYSYRGNGSGWKPLGDLDVLSNEGIQPLAIDSAQNSLYALRKIQGRQALYRVSLDGSLRQDLVLSRPDVDIDDVVRIGRSRRPVGATFATDVRQAVYFDPELNQLGDALGRSLKTLPLIDFVDSSADESKLLIRASSDVDPGRFYVFDKGKHSLNEIMLIRPQLEGVPLAKVQSISYRAADGTMVPAYLTLPPSGQQKNIPAIVMPHGGPSARDEWGFDWLSQYYAAAGYAVIQPNYRGSTGFGDDWYDKNGFQSWSTAIHDVTDAGRWLVSQGIAAAGKLAIVGWSYGGYAALQSAATVPALYKAVVAIAPVTDLGMLKEDARNFTNSNLVEREIGDGPHLVEGSPLHRASDIRVPVLLAHGDTDSNVRISHSRKMEAALTAAGRDVHMLSFGGLDHQLDDSDARTEMLTEIGKLLDRTIGH